VKIVCRPIDLLPRFGLHYIEALAGEIHASIFLNFRGLNIVGFNFSFGTSDFVPAQQISDVLGFGI
jgi:hypothetical protein